jgi:uncharacterized protein YjbJ (UPF0337 family)
VPIADTSHSRGRQLALPVKARSKRSGQNTDDDLTAINGKSDELEGKIQKRYGLAKDQVKKDVDDGFSTESW